MEQFEADTRGQSVDERTEHPDGWAVGAETDCEHPDVASVPLGVGGGFDYARCRDCGAVVVSRLGR